MLFLLNDRVLMIAGGRDLLEKTGMPLNFVTNCTTADAVLAMQTAIFENPDLARQNPTKAAALAWLLNARTGANTAMFMLTMAKAKNPRQVAYKLATTDLTTLGALNALQNQGRLTTNVINESVWKKVA